MAAKQRQHNQVAHLEAQDDEVARCPIRPDSPPFKNGHTLTPYQVEGLNWLLFCWSNRRNSILADEMGIGKTIEALSLFETLKNEYGIGGPFLVVAPLSTIPNWLHEIDEWTNFRAVTFYSNEQTRWVIKDHLFYKRLKNGKLDTGQMIVDIVVVSYEMAKIESVFLSRIQFVYAVFDEAHRLKNWKAQTYEVCQTLWADHVLLMTGTPIQNNVSELWSLLHFLNPDEFDDCDSFIAEYSDITETADFRPFSRSSSRICCVVRRRMLNCLSE